MIKLEALEDFTLKKFDEIKNIIRKDKEEKGKIFYGDIFVCEKELAEYVTNTGKEPNPANRAVAKIIEVMPEIEFDKTAKEIKITAKELKNGKVIDKKPITKKRKTTKK